MRKTILLLVIALLLPRGADADPITLTGAGILFNVREDLLQAVFGSTPAVGDPFTFKLTFSDVSADLNAHPSSGVYSLGTGSVAVTLGNLSFTQSGPVNGGISLDQDWGTGPITDILSIALGDETQGIDVSLAAFGPQWLSTDVWPIDVAAALNGSPRAIFNVVDPAFGDEPTSLASGPILHTAQAPAPAPVPEPTSLLLLGSGVLVAAGARRWRQRKAS